MYSYNPYNFTAQPNGYPITMPQYQPPQPVRQQPGLRTVSSADEITVQEVPTDGSIALFPLADGSAVIGKRWMPDGSISTTRFVPEHGVADQPVDPFQAINDRIDNIFDALDDIRNNMPHEMHARRRTAKKVIGDE